jgi:hypothetical protein
MSKDLDVHPASEAARANARGEAFEVDGDRCLAGADRSPLSTSKYVDATLQALHQALRTAQSIAAEDGPRLDSLASALKRLADHCHENAVRFTRIEFEQGGHSLAEQVLAMERQRARTIADAVHAVSKLVQGRALGDLEQRELNASWLRLWASVAALPRQPTDA